MGIQILDGTGNGNVAAVDGNGRLQVGAVTNDALTDASAESGAFNAPTPTISLTLAGGASGVFYLKNTDPSRQMVLERLYVSLGGSSVSGNVLIELLANPTGGTLLSGGTAVVPVNRNLGSNIPAVGTFLYGAAGSTVTGGVLISSRLPQDKTQVEIVNSFRLPNGAAIAVRVTSPGNMDVRVTAVFYYVTKG
jgi:hypothetical protein